MFNGDQRMVQVGSKQDIYIYMFAIVNTKQIKLPKVCQDIALTHLNLHIACVILASS